MILAIIFSVLAYLLGSIPFGVLIGRLVKGIDVRQFGSGNVGATNIFRVIGKKWGLLVFFLDALKGYAAIQIPARFINPSLESPIFLVFGIAAILGHSFPVWLGFCGGKGVATSLGVFIAIVPIPALLTFGAWVIIFLASRILSVASLSAAVLFPIVLILAFRHHALFNWIFSVSILLAFFIFYTHRANIRRLIKGEEKRLF